MFHCQKGYYNYSKLHAVFKAIFLKNLVFLYILLLVKLGFWILRLKLHAVVFVFLNKSAKTSRLPVTCLRGLFGLILYAFQNKKLQRSQLQNYFARFCVGPALLPPRSAFERSAAAPEVQNGKNTQAADKIMTKYSFAIGSKTKFLQRLSDFVILLATRGNGQDDKVAQTR